MSLAPAGFSNFVTQRRAASDVIVVGGGFGGLAAAHELAARGIRCTLLEASDELGGLAAGFAIPGGRIERFYHHWYNSDRAIVELVRELGLADQLIESKTRTGMYFSNRIFRLDSLTDLLRFRPLSMAGRLRLGLLALRTKWLRDTVALEHRTASEWLQEQCGPEVYRVVWEPLLRGKFGRHADEVSATWFCHKLKLRGGSRDGAAREQLLYFRGGFTRLVEQWAEHLQSRGVELRRGMRVDRIRTSQGRADGVEAGGEFLPATQVIVTTPLPSVAPMVPDAPESWRQQCSSIRHLANLCVVLALRESLSETYWLNVNDPGFPFVAVIEHTNLDPPERYGGLRFVYLSRYLPEDDQLLQASDEDVIEYCLPHLQRMFPNFRREWLVQGFVWRALAAQPIVTRGYSRQIPPLRTPIDGLWLSTMAQIYPEDRGTNYAVVYGRRAGAMAAEAVDASARNR